MAKPVENNELKVTSITSLQDYAKGELVELPPFAENQPFVARLRRPSLLAMAKSGKIPNSLLTTASDLFEGKNAKMEKVDEQTLVQLHDVVELLCQASFVEPTYAQILEAGIELTDEQMIAVFNYTQRGARALTPFRK